ncbi:nicotinate (nicotinamide) nucleotide adenylyltransferase [Fibrella forsythiae]|uniref:Probable nicotinate-nucleotide adenylyltransferase n=1 Tax=Fibrella forsythiae TaxID=2817061 RepID=A0ABS3JK96_9BACT|nr:nicotinate (nicotinamide) nucleotide adenylyltransferase [Fibrella forsythiae]MBO0950423.1 nicotinate-nucleotide adenylyltransferase [Fibrella forsythiae]
MKIGLFFGSFNPIHVGHLIVANTMATSADLEQVWFVVSPQNPFKKTKSLLHEFDRLDMVERAIADNNRLKATDVEFSMPKPSYTIDTLDVLSQKFPQHTFKLIMGEDNLDQFANWKQYERILNNVGLYVYPRPARLGELASPSPFREHPNVRLIAAPLLDISATYIRDAIRLNRSIRYMVPDVVEEMIERKKFYV